MLALLLQLFGLLLLVVGGFLASPWLGVAAVGGVAVFVGVALDAHRGGGG